MTKQQRKAYRAAKAVQPSLTRVQFVTSPEGREYRTPEQIETPVQQFDRVAREVSDYMRQIQRRSAKVRWSGLPAAQKRERMSALAKRRWAKRKPANS